MTTPVRARLQLAGAAVLFSTGGAGIKACGLSSWQVASFRSGVAALFFLAVLRVPWSRKSWSVWPAVCAYAATMVLFVAGNKLTTAANTIFLQSTAPLYVLLLGPLLLHEPVRRRDVLFLATVAAGLAMVVGGEQPIAGTAPNPFLGNLFAACSGLTWAATIVGFRWAGKSPVPELVPTVLVLGNLLACAATLPAALPLGPTLATDWIIIVSLGVFQIGFSYLLLAAGVRHVGAFEVSLLLLLEPALNPVWAWLIHGEAPGPWPLAGGALILASTTLKAMIDARPSYAPSRRA